MKLRSIAWGAMLGACASSAMAVSLEWTQVAGMPTARTLSNPLAVVSGDIYAIGGTSVGQTLALSEEYHHGADNWENAPRMPVPRADFGLGVLGGMVYVVGGEVAGEGVKADVYVFDPATGLWTAKAPLSAARSDLTVAVVNDKLYAIGGQDGTYLQTVEEYDPLLDAWTSKTPMPTARANAVSVVFEGKIYVAGGDNGTALGTLEVYNPLSNTWVAEPSMPTARAAAGAVSVYGSIYVLGGSANGQVLGTVERYDASVDAWYPMAPMGVARAGVGAAVVEQKIFVFGGSDGVTELNTVEVADVGLPENYQNQKP